jgi:hypothetical protein
MLAQLLAASLSHFRLWRPGLLGIAPLLRVVLLTQAPRLYVPCGQVPSLVMVGASCWVQSGSTRRPHLLVTQPITARVETLSSPFRKALHGCSNRLLVSRARPVQARRMTMLCITRRSLAPSEIAETPRSCCRARRLRSPCCDSRSLKRLD